MVGDAIADGSALKTNYVDKYHGLTEKDLEKMSVKELEEHENEMAEHNTMHIVEDVCQRINDELDPVAVSCKPSLLTDKVSFHLFK